MASSSSLAAGFSAPSSSSSPLRAPATLTGVPPGKVSETDTHGQVSSLTSPRSGAVAASSTTEAATNTDTLVLVPMEGEAPVASNPEVSIALPPEISLAGQPEAEQQRQTFLEKLKSYLPTGAIPSLKDIWEHLPCPQILEQLLQQQGERNPEALQQAAELATEKQKEILAYRAEIGEEKLKEYVERSGEKYATSGLKLKRCQEIKAAIAAEVLKHSEQGKQVVVSYEQELKILQVLFVEEQLLREWSWPKALLAGGLVGGAAGAVALAAGAGPVSSAYLAAGLLFGITGKARGLPEMAALGAIFNKTVAWYLAPLLKGLNEAQRFGLSLGIAGLFEYPFLSYANAQAQFAQKATAMSNWQRGLDVILPAVLIGLTQSLPDIFDIAQLTLAVTSVAFSSAENIKDLAKNWLGGEETPPVAEIKEPAINPEPQDTRIDISMLEATLEPPTDIHAAAANEEPNPDMAKQADLKPQIENVDVRLTIPPEEILPAAAELDSVKNLIRELENCLAFFKQESQKAEKQNDTTLQELVTHLEGELKDVNDKFQGLVGATGIWQKLGESQYREKLKLFYTVSCVVAGLSIGVTSYIAKNPWALVIGASFGQAVAWYAGSFLAKRPEWQRWLISVSCCGSLEYPFLSKGNELFAERKKTFVGRGVQDGAWFVLSFIQNILNDGSLDIYQKIALVLNMLRMGVVGLKVAVNP